MANNFPIYKQTKIINLSKKKLEDNVISIAEGLSKKYTIPSVKRAQALIENIKKPGFFKGISQKKLDEVREELRELVQYLESSGKTIIYTNLQDSEVTLKINQPNLISNYGDAYKRRVESFIRENKYQLTISKLSSNLPITVDELTLLENLLFDGGERGTKEDFIKQYGAEPLGVFIRSIIGLDSKAAQEAFAGFLSNGNLSSDQITFVQNIIAYLTKNGTIEPSMLFEPPFTDTNDQGILGLFNDGEAHHVIGIIKQINQNAVVA